MKSQDSTKLIQNLLKNNDGHGFTIIELLVVIIVIGILSAIALPSFLNCGTKAKLSEGKTYIGSINRGQQAYFLDHKKLTNSLDKLEIGINSQTTNYNYSIKTTNSAAYNYGIARIQNIKSFVGGVFIIPTEDKSEMTTVTIVCESNSPTTKAIAEPIYDHEKGLATCGVGTKELGR